MLSRLGLAGFKSIDELEDLELRDLNVLVGPNGAGKSNFISFFEMLSWMEERRLARYVARQGGASSILHYGPKTTDEMRCELVFDAEDGPHVYEIEWSYAGDDELMFEGETIRFWPTGDGSYRAEGTLLNRGKRESSFLEVIDEDDDDLLDASSFTNRVLSQCQIYHFHDTTRKAEIRQTTDVDRDRYLYDDGRNLAAVLYRLKCEAPKYYDRIVSVIRDVFPQFDDFDLPEEWDDPEHVKLDWREVGREYPLGPSQLSDGTLRFMALATLLFQPEDDLPGLIILDEPELGLHPYAIQKLAALFRHASEEAQLLVSTQSPTLIDHLDPEDVVVVEREDGASTFERLDAEELDNWLEDYTMGELWQKNVIGGQP